MREIKFRAHFKRLGWIVPVERINFDCKTVEVDLTNGNGDIAEYDFDEIDLMEYTGLHDKNGKEIYEGDIVKAWVNFGPAGDDERTYAVKITPFGTNIQSWVFDHEDGLPEIIGNIHNNPEIECKL